MKKKNKIIFLSIISIIVTYFINKLIFYLTTINNYLFSQNSYYYSWRFGKIHYTKQGTGEPILLIHTLDPMSSSYEWKKLIKELKKQYTVYTIDLIGCGCSEKPKLTYTSYLYVQLLTDFIKNVIKEPTNILSSGLSCSFTTLACYQNPNNFKKLLFINPTSLQYLAKYPKKRQKCLKFILELPIVGTLFYNIMYSKFFIRIQLKYFLFSNQKRITNKLIKYYHESSHLNGDSSRYLFSSLKNQYVNINIIHALKQINNSIYIIVGEDIKDFKKIIESYKQANYSIETSIIKNTKYLPQIENTSKILEICKIYFI